uniref:Uncharacterized protein n=1 Tax=Neolamprologus brichardi TaxID=32507 RepID=A0A3Q4H011_NEOBR
LLASVLTGSSGADVSPASLRFFQIEEVTFKNSYTAYVTVRLLRRNPEQEAPAKWLMTQPAAGQEVQRYEKASASNVKYDPGRSGGMIVSPCVTQGLPDPLTVSSSIQQMWALTEVMQTNQTTASIGRFDVDGCYDISLLSLT